MRNELSDGVITLRRYSMADVRDLFTAVQSSVAEVYPWLPWCRPGYTLDEAEAWLQKELLAWESGSDYEFAIRTATGIYVGGAGINGVCTLQARGNLGYWVRSGQKGLGYASRAARLLRDFGLDDLGLQRIEIVAALSNIGSLRVAEKAEAHREGVLRNRIMLHGQPHDAVMHSFVPGR